MEATTVLLLGLVAIIALIALVAGIGLWRGPRAFYIRREALLTGEEVSLMDALDDFAGDKYRVMAKVGINGLIGLRARLARKARRHALNRICGEFFDYVLLDRRSLVPVLTILVETATTPRRQRRRHAYVKKLCDAIGLPLIIIQPVDTHPEYLHRMIGDAVHMAAPARSTDARQEPAVVINHVGG